MLVLARHRSAPACAAHRTSTTEAREPPPSARTGRATRLFRSGVGVGWGRGPWPGGVGPTLNGNAHKRYTRTKTLAGRAHKRTARRARGAAVRPAGNYFLFIGEIFVFICPSPGRRRRRRRRAMCIIQILASRQFPPGGQRRGARWTSVFPATQ